MAKMIKMTFERGGEIYAELQENAAPHIVEKFCKTLPITYPMLHGRYAGPAMFFNTSFDNIGAAVAVALIACLSIYTGVHIRKNQETNSNGPGIVAGLIMGTLVGGSSTIGTAQLAYHYGMSAWWFTLGAGIACLIQALLYTKPLRKSQCRTLVGMIGREFGERSGIVASLLNSLGTFINILSQMIAASAVILVIFPHIGNEWPLIISAAVMVLYVAFGGTKGAGMAGVLKLCMLYAAMLLCAVAAVKLFGGGTNVISSVRLLSEETGINYFSLLARGAGEDLGACLSLILGVLTTQTYLIFLSNLAYISL